MLYLMRKLKRFGLSIYDKTEESFWANRGEGIHVWLSANEDVTAWVVLDDETFPDYEKYGIDKHLSPETLSRQKRCLREEKPD